MRTTRSTRARCTLGAAVAVGLAGAAASAQPPPARVALRWTAPAECPASSEVVAEVDRILGERGARPPKPLEVSAVVSGTGGSFRVRVETTGSDATRVRTLQARTCAALANATALVIALAIDPQAVPPESTFPADTAPSGTPPPPSSASPPSAPPSSPAPPPSAPPSSAPSSAPPSSAPPPSPRPARTARAASSPSSSASSAEDGTSPPEVPRPDAPGATLIRSVRIAAWGGADAGSLPTVAAGLGAEVSAILGRLRLGAGVEIYPERQKLVQEEAGGVIGLVAGYGGACYPIVAGAVEVGPCAEVELGRIHALGVGVDHPDDGSSVWVAPRAGGLLAWFPLESIGLRVRAGAAFPLVRPTFKLRNVGTVDRPGPVAGRLEAGAELRF